MLESLPLQTAPRLAASLPVVKQPAIEVSFGRLLYTGKKTMSSFLSADEQLDLLQKGAAEIIR
ncbi:MAG: hypothetical protein K6T49_07170, partial [Acidobacterium ailaaui]|nr:hypothetical protein [Pseudacidobacterium ailaaui]